MFISLPSALSVWVCTRSFRYAGRAVGTLYRTVRGNRRLWRLWICLRLHASGRAAIATCGPSKQAAPRMKIQLLWIQSHHHPPLQAIATAPTPVSTREKKVVLVIAIRLQRFEITFETFNSFWIDLYSTNSQKRWPKGALHYKEKTLKY